jgi:hypothetical protein
MVEEEAETVVAPAGCVGGSDDFAVEFVVDVSVEGDFVFCALAGHGTERMRFGRRSILTVTLGSEPTVGWGLASIELAEWIVAGVAVHETEVAAA